MRETFQYWVMDAKFVIVQVEGCYGRSEHNDEDQWDLKLGIAIALRRAVLAFWGWELNMNHTMDSYPRMSTEIGKFSVNTRIFDDFGLLIILPPR